MASRSIARLLGLSGPSGADRVRTGTVRFADIESRSLSVGCSNPDAPTVILLHGFTDSADTWRPVLKKLADSNVHAIALDMPQFGTTTRSSRRDLTMFHKEFLTEALAYFDKGSGFILVGNSFGGWDCLHAALDQPQRVQSVVAISPAGLRTGGMVALLGKFARLPQAIPLAMLGSSLITRLPILANGVMVACYAVGGFNGRFPPGLSRSFYSHIKNGDLTLWLSFVPEVMDEITNPGSLRLNELECPVQLIWGTHDWLVTASGAKFAKMQNPSHISVEFLPGACHCAQVQHPEKVAHAIIEHIERVKPERPVDT